MKKIYYIILAIVVVLAVSGTVFYFRQQVYYSHGNTKNIATFEIKKGEGNAEIASRLQKEGLISGKIYFYYYLRSRGLTNKILPGQYKISGDLTIPEIALVITEDQNRFTKVTFPEGWTAKQMAERLTANGLPGDEFLKIVLNPGDLKNQYDFLSSPEIKTLEGYLFPDTYFFAKDAKAQDIVKKMLGIFNTKITQSMLSDAGKSGRKMNEIITMASIIEDEVKTDEDRKIVSGIFWKRSDQGGRLQSCATIAYVLGEKKKQYSENDTKVESPYNTYLNKGLPPAPISNPGISAISAAIYPTMTEYNYFLSDPETGKTIFSKTYEEHVSNKAKYGL